MGQEHQAQAFSAAALGLAGAAGSLVKPAPWSAPGDRVSPCCLGLWLEPEGGLRAWISS